MIRQITADILLEMNLGENGEVHVVSDTNLVVGENRVFTGFDCMWEGKSYTVILRMTLDNDVLRLECVPPHVPDMCWWDYNGYRIDYSKHKKPRRTDLGFKFYQDYVQKALYRIRAWMNEPENADRIAAWKRSWAYKDN